MKSFWMCLLVLLFAIPASSDDLIWEGTSSGFKIRWTTTEIVAVNLSTQKVAFSAKKLADTQWKEVNEFIKEERKSDPAYNPKCSYDRTLKLLSVVGPILSYVDEGYSFCSDDAHPSVSEVYSSVDLRNPGELQDDKLKYLSLDTIFGETTVYNALTGDSYIQKALKAAQIRENPKNLPNFVSILVEKSGCEFGIDSDLLERFAFHHIEGNKVAIRVGASHTTHVCKKEITELGLLLPIPDKLAEDLKLAESGKQGFLQKDLKRIAGARTTQISYSLGGDSPR